MAWSRQPNEVDAPSRGQMKRQCGSWDVQSDVHYRALDVGNVMVGLALRRTARWNERVNVAQTVGNMSTAPKTKRATAAFDQS